MKKTAESINVKRITEITGKGLTLASGMISEFGDVRKYETPKQMRKIVGLSLVKDSFGKKRKNGYQ